MSIVDDLSFGFRRRLPLILQTEAAECGLACLAMVASFHGNRTGLASLRARHTVSLKGATLAGLIEVAEQLQLSARPLRLELSELGKLQTPCILHWNFNHFVVLKECDGRTSTLHDPALGVRKLALAEMSDCFTGVGLELWPNPGFEPKPAQPPVSLRELMGKVTGLAAAFAKVLLLAAALEVFILVSPFFLQWVVDQAIVSADRDLLTTLALGFALLILMRVAIGAIRSWMLMFMGTTLNVQWRANAFAHLMRLPLQYFQRRHVGDIQSRFGSIDQVQATITSSFIEVLLDGVMSVALVAMMYAYSPGLASICIGTMVLYGLGRWASYGKLQAATHSQIVFSAKQDTHFLESIRGARTIKLFQHEDRRRITWLGLLVDQINAGLEVQKLKVLYGSVNSLLIGLEAILVVWLGAKMVLDGSLSVGMLIAFKAYNDQFSGRLSSLIDKLLQFKLLRTHGERLADILLSEPEVTYRSERSPVRLDRSHDIAVDQLCFRYAPQDSWVLQNVSFVVAAGESVALVGPSGCGKSTLLSVLLGILPATSGDVHVGGISVRQLGIGTLRQLVGSVLQDDVLFAGSIADNISFFDPQPDWARIEEVARLAAVHEEIAEMPMGYNSLVGDMGTVLSGGQKQRVLLARALYRRPKILFLDEATSHLDLEKERQVNAAIKALNITRLIVAHRPETIASATRVIALVNGKVLNDGPRSHPTISAVS